MDIPLGKPTTYPERYDAALLAPMEREPARRAMGIGARPPFTGEDVWTGYEFSWLASSGLPRVGIVRIRVGAASPRIVESKSMKLYLNGFAGARFESRDAVTRRLERDLSPAFGADVSVTVLGLEEAGAAHGIAPGLCLDDLDVTVTRYERAPELLEADDALVVEESLHTNLFRSLCPVTRQPDWATILVRYRGPAIAHTSLLRYLVSFRRHQGFHETTVERMFLDLKAHCRCERLLVGGYFLRRGGIDINPFRVDVGEDWPVARLVRQ